MEKLLWSTTAILAVTLGVLGFFMYRDVFSAQEGVINVSACQPTSYEVSDIGISSFTLQWESQSECVGFLVYGESVSDTDRVGAGSYGFAKKQLHEIEVTDLSPGKTYYVYISSGDVLYGEGGSTIQIKMDRY